MWACFRTAAAASYYLGGAMMPSPNCRTMLRHTACSLVRSRVGLSRRSAGMSSPASLRGQRAACRGKFATLRADLQGGRQLMSLAPTAAVQKARKRSQKAEAAEARAAVAPPAQEPASSAEPPARTSHKRRAKEAEPTAPAEAEKQQP